MSETHLSSKPVNSKRTVSDTKRTFFSTYPRPVNSIYRRVIDELLVEAHLLMVNEDFRYDPLFATGLLTAYEALMGGYSPADQREPIFQAFCTALELDAQQLRRDVQQWHDLATLPAQEVLEVLAGTREPATGALHAVGDTLTGIRGSERFKYSRLFVVGLDHIIGQICQAAGLGEKERYDRLQQVCTYLKIDYDRAKRDLDFFNAALDRIKRSKEVVDELIAADRRKREERPVSNPG